MIAIQLPPDTESRLESIARTKGCTLDEYIREVLLTALEDAEDIADAEEGLADLRAGRLKVIPDEKMPLSP